MSHGHLCPHPEARGRCRKQAVLVGVVLGRQSLRAQGDAGDYGGGSSLGDERAHSSALAAEFNVSPGEKEKVAVA